MNAEPASEIQPPKKGRKKAILMVALSLVAIITGGIWIMWPREPSYGGKPLSYWLKQYDELGPMRANTENPEEIACREAIRHIGTNAMPYLLRMLRAKDSALKDKYGYLLRRHSPKSLKLSTAYDENNSAASVFWCLGELATNSIPALVDIYTNPPSEWSRDAADSALKALYPASGATIPFLVPPKEQARWYSDTGDMHSNLGAESNAVLAYSDAIRLNPTNAMFYINRGVLKFQMQDLAGAVSDCTRSIDLRSSNFPALRIRGVCKLGLRDFAGAESDLTAAVNLRTNDFSPYNWRGLARANLRKFDDAIADFNTAIELESDEALPYRNRAAVETMQKDYELALEDVSKAIELDGHDPVAYQVRGQIRNALRDHKSALQDFDKAIELNPKDPAGYAGHGIACLRADDLTRAGADLEKALQLDPKNVTALAIRGLLKARRGDQDAEVLADLERAVELGGQIPDTRALLGLFQYRCNQWEPALNNCRKALEMGARDGLSDLRASIWLIRAQTGEKVEASQELESFLQSLPSSKTNVWEASVARYFSDSLTESNFLNEAKTTAKRPSNVIGQTCESFYYAGMKHKIAGDKQGALELFKKCVETKDNNNIACWNAATEMRGLTNK